MSITSLTNRFPSLLKRVKPFFALIVVGCCCLTTSISAANQGNLSTSSSGDLDITLTLGLLARVTGFSDFNFGTWNAGDLSANDDLCVGLFGATQYRIRATGDGNASDLNAFALSNGSDFVDYRVFFNDQTGTTGQVELNAANVILGQNAPGSFFNLFGCFIQNANIQILIEETNLASAPAGNYSGTLTLTVIPE